MSPGASADSAADPGCLTSPNEQDQRHWSRFLYFPVFDPATPEDARNYLRRMCEIRYFEEKAEDLYVRGLVLDYRAGWQSTFLDAPAVRAVLRESRAGDYRATGDTSVVLHTAWRLSLERASELCATKATKSVPDKAQTAARLNTWRGFATPYGADSPRLLCREV